MKNLSEKTFLEIIDTQKFQDRFWSGVKKQPNDCWEWQRGKMRGGYGRIRVGYKRYGTHQVSFAMEHKTIPPNFVRHKCNNTSCCNPSHLLAGNSAENLEDMFNAFRHSSQKEKKRKILADIIHTFTIDEKKLLYEFLQKEFQ